MQRRKIREERGLKEKKPTDSVKNTQHPNNGDSRKKQGNVEEFTPDTVLRGWRETHTKDQDLEPSERAGVGPWLPGAAESQCKGRVASNYQPSSPV